MQTEQLIKLPELGEGVTEGELVKWLVSQGENLKIDQAVAEVMTDKAVMEVPSPVEGVVDSLLAKEGDTLSVGQDLLRLKSSLAQKSEEDQVEKSAQASKGDQQLVSSKVKAEPASLLDKASLSHSVQASPFTRQWAKKLKVDLSQVPVSSSSGRVTQKDVLQYVQDRQNQEEQKPQQGKASLALGFEVPREEGQDRQALKGIRKKIAQKMQVSKAVIPHFTLLESAEVEALEKLKFMVKEDLKEKHIKVTYLSFVMKALLQTLKEFPILNASLDDVAQEIVYKHYYHFGFAVDTDRGLLVPVIKHIDKKSIAELSYEIQTLAEKAREGRITTEDMQGGTVTITNIGSLGGEYGTPIINAPEATILGMYRIFVQAVWDGSKFVPKKTMNFSLTCDHRLIDGAVSARALKYFIHKIENPLSLFI